MKPFAVSSIVVKCIKVLILVWNKCILYVVKAYFIYASLTLTLKSTSLWMTSFTVTVIGNLCLTNREITVPSVPTTMVWLWWRSTNHLRQATQGATMDFNGTWKVFHQENLENFLKAIGWLSFHLLFLQSMYMYIWIFFFLSGAPEMVRKMRKDVKPVITIEQNGADFTFTIKTPLRTQSHSFSIGKESEITGVDGRKFKVIWDHLILCQVSV